MCGFVHRTATNDQSHAVYMQCVGLYTGQLQMTNLTQSTCNVWVCTQDSYKWPSPTQSSCNVWVCTQDSYT
ncbi:hypothetical protein DPMN_127804 [Dreissena polymorpha]|uniref:Uncharacterized protein n=1 Tax=Dreissena polymorpha TaxID=45954 RepID=A0A9D4JZI5_DREPO|nr:hypothetical protein DPMN_127804 [Dreissena polymorpha]